MSSHKNFRGNVRDLSDLIEKAVLLALEVARGKATGTVACDPLADDWPSLDVLRRRYVDRVLSFTGGNKTHSARILGVDRRSLNRMLARERSQAKGRRPTLVSSRSAV